MATYPRKGLQRILAGSHNPDLRATLRDQDGSATAVDESSTVTCTITRADGTVVDTDRSATAAATRLTVALTTAEAQILDVLTAVWKIDGTARATSHHRIVGGFLFGVDDVMNLGGLSKFDGEPVRRARDATIDMIERETGVCWNPTFDLEEFRGFGRCTHASTFRPLRTVRALSLDGAAQDVTQLDINTEAGLIYGDLPLAGWTVLGVEHGFDDPPQDLRDAAMQACKSALLQTESALGKRVRSISDEQGTRTFSFAGKGHPTGIDDIDAVIAAYDMRDPY